MNNVSLNLMKISERIGEDKENLLAMPLGKLLEIQEEIKCIELSQKPVVPLERYIKFFRMYDEFVALFGKELVDKYLVKVSFDQIASAEHFRSEPRHIKEREFLRKETWSFEECHPRNYDYTKRVSRLAEVYLVPHQYQGLVHTSIIKPILLEMFPWLADFDLSIYELRNYGAVEEFYVKLENTSLYVPYKAFLNKDADRIIERNVSYLSSYYSSKEKREEAIEKVQKSEMAKTFLWKLKNA